MRADGRARRGRPWRTSGPAGESPGGVGRSERDGSGGEGSGGEATGGEGPGAEVITEPAPQGATAFAIANRRCCERQRDIFSTFVHLGPFSFFFFSFFFSFSVRTDHLGVLFAHWCPQ